MAVGKRGLGWGCKEAYTYFFFLRTKVAGERNKNITIFKINVIACSVFKTRFRERDASFREKKEQQTNAAKKKKPSLQQRPSSVARTLYANAVCTVFKRCRVVGTSYGQTLFVAAGFDPFDPVRLMLAMYPCTVHFGTVTGLCRCRSMTVFFLVHVY